MAAMPRRAGGLCVAAVGAVLRIAAASSSSSKEVASVFTDRNGKLMLKAGILAPDAAVAVGSFENGLNDTGWGLLNIRTFGGHAGASFSDELQHEVQHGISARAVTARLVGLCTSNSICCIQAAGMVEGYLTAMQIYPTYLNNKGFTFGSKAPSAAVVRFLSDQESWAKKQAALRKSSDPIWRHVAAVLSQFDGLVNGYALHPSAPTIDRFGFQMLNAIGDLFQIIPAVEKSARLDWDNLTRSEKLAALRRQGHCSALIKVTGAFEDLFMAHSSWFEYQDMNRIFKHYAFDFSVKHGASKISFASYPGYLESLDDFYMMDSGLGMVQTSNGVMNNTLFSLITPQSLLAWQRVRVASAYATSGQEWYSTFRTAASGTYVNQYMVTDFKKFSPGQPLQEGLLWVVEEIPGLVKGEDQTEILERGYWPSYNVPFYGEIYSRSGYQKHIDGAFTIQPVGDGLGSEYVIGAPRAKLFRRDQATVVDMASLKRFMRYANYSDPYAVDSKGKVDYGAAICMRGDLSDKGRGSSGGCYDSKVTSWRHGFFNQTCEAVNGPSSSASEPTSLNPPFHWRSTDANHLGLPQTYNFPFLRIGPSM